MSFESLIYVDNVPEVKLLGLSWKICGAAQKLPIQMCKILYVTSNMGTKYCPNLISNPKNGFLAPNYPQFDAKYVKIGQCIEYLEPF